MEKSYVSKFTREIIVLICAIVVSFILQLVGFVTPGWVRMSMDIPDVKISLRADIGLWYSKVQYCNISGCIINSAKEWSQDSAIQSQDVGDVEIMSIIALVTCIVALFASVLLRRQVSRGQLPKILLIVSFTASAVSGAMAMSATTYIGDATRRENTKLLRKFNEYYTKSIFIFPYSVFLAGLGGLLIGPFTLSLLLAVWWKLNIIIRSHLYKAGIAMTTLS